MNLNTTESIKTASYAMAAELEDTKKNMKAKMAAIGVGDYKPTKVRLPRIAGSGDDVIFLSINGQAFYLQRGESYDLPPQLIELLENAGEI